jgi:NodT family efflux transporter outer membrane factor (OMF) lipoprotein
MGAPRSTPMPTPMPMRSPWPSRRAGGLLPLAAALLLAGCTAFAPTGPMPDPAADAQQRVARHGLEPLARFDAAVDPAEPAADDVRWWRRFGDPALAARVERALAADLDVAAAAERVQQARALLAQARAARGVQAGASAGVQANLRRRGDERRIEPSAALALDWDVDLWGGLRAGERAAAAGLARQQHLLQAQRLTAAGLAARAYLEWRLARADAALLDDALAVQDEALRVVGVRVEAGLSPRLDRERARAERAVTEAERAAATVRAGRALASLQVLAGERPRPATALDDAAADAAPARAPLPQAGRVAAGRPADLLRRRPDLRASEQALLAAAAEVGVAAAELRPRLRLPASLVLGGSGLADVVAATVGAALDLVLVDGGARRAGLDAARSRYREAVLAHEQTLLQALEQVETALLAERGAQARVEASGRAAEAADEAVRQAATLYRAGLTNFLDVADAQRSALDNRRAQLQARADVAAAAVLAFEALGLIDEPGPATAAPRDARREPSGGDARAPGAEGLTGDLH